jgi:DNA-binding response OmpR family regulator
VRKRVLVLEDDPAVRASVVAALGEDGYLIVSASTGEIALGECVVVDPNVIVLDLHLPGMDGREFLRQYRAKGGRARVIALSAVTESDPLTQGLEVEDFVGKPFDIEHLLRAVRKLAG